MLDFGVLLIDKPAGITSFDVIRRLRKITNIRKIGHTGTLDPFASGLLPVCVGKATKIARFFSDKEKEYLVKIRLGKRTDTGDIEGKIVAEMDIPDLNSDKIESVIPEILALKEQIPPRFSAVKVNGKRAYDLARQNQQFDLKSRPIKLFNFEIKKVELPYISYQTKVSKGTYIRVLSETFAEKLGTIATTIELRRNMIGNLKIEDAVSLEKITAGNWWKFLKPLTEILSDFPKVKLDLNKISDFKNGKFITYKKDDENDVMVIDENQNCLGFADMIEGKLKPKIVMI